MPIQTYTISFTNWWWWWWWCQMPIKERKCDSGYLSLIQSILRWYLGLSSSPYIIVIRNDQREHGVCHTNPNLIRLPTRIYFPRSFVAIDLDWSGVSTPIKCPRGILCSATVERKWTGRKLHPNKKRTREQEEKCHRLNDRNGRQEIK